MSRFVTKVNLGIIAKALLFLGIFEVLVNRGGGLFPVLPKWALGITAGGVIGAIMVVVTYFFLKSEKLTMSDLGMTFGKGSLVRFLLSLGAGMVFFGCFFLVYLWLTPVTVLRVTDLDIFNAIVVSFFALLMLAAMEEIVFRGYFLKKLESAVGIRVAIYVSSIAFGLYHGLSFDSLTGPAIWGLWYGTMVYWSKGLAIPIGFHTGVNLVQAVFSEKEKWASGIWTFDVADKITPFTVGQVSTGLQVLLLIIGVVLVEIYISKNGKRSAGDGMAERVT